MAATYTAPTHRRLSVTMDRRDAPFSATIRRFSGFAHSYDRFRPHPPTALAMLLAQITGAQRPGLVVDLGCGTGLSTRYWADKATQVIGIEPNDEMREIALQQTGVDTVSYRPGYSHATGLDGHCAHIVTCMQALHWMEPVSTFREVARLLVPGGVFAAIDYDWPPVTHAWRVDQLWMQCNERATQMEQSLPGERPRRWSKPTHLERMRNSGCFRYVNESTLHHIDQGNAQRSVGLLRSQGGVMDLLKSGVTEQALGLSELAQVAAVELGSELRPWYWSARVRIGVV